MSASRIGDLGAQLAELKAGDVGEEAVRAAWESEFTCFESDLADALPEALHSPQETADRLREVVTEASSGWAGEATLWGKIVDAVDSDGFSPKALVAFLYCGIEHGLRKEADLAEMGAGCASAELYLSLVTWPGSDELKLFHVNMFQRSLACLDICVQKIKQSEILATQAKKRGSAKMKPRAEEDNEGQEAEEPLDREGVALVREWMERLLLSLWSMLRSPNPSLAEGGLLEGASECLSVCCGSANGLLELEEKGVKEVDVRPPLTAAAFGRLPLKAKAFALFTALAAPNHERSAWRTFQKLKSRLLMHSFGMSSDKTTNIPASVVALKDAAEAWVRCLFAQIREGDEERRSQLQRTLQCHLRFLTQQVTEKAEYRRHLCVTIVGLFDLLDKDGRAAFIRWLKGEATGRDANRGFIAELCGQFLKVAAEDADSALGRQLSSAMFTIIIRLSLDKAFSSASRSLVVLAGVMKEPRLAHLTEILRSLPHHILTHPTASPPDRNGVPDEPEEETEVAEATAGGPESPGAKDATKRVVARAPRVVPYDEAEEFVAGDVDDWALLRILHFHSQQESAKLRQNSLLAYEALGAVALGSGADGTGAECLRKLGLHGRDASVMVRRTATEALTRLLSGDGCLLGSFATLQEAWLNTVLPSVMDYEDSGAKKGRELVLDVLLRPLTGAQDDSARKLAWTLIARVETSKDHQRYLIRCLRKAQMEEDKKDRVISQETVNAIDAMTSEPTFSSGAWMLLSNLCESFTVTGRNAWAEIKDVASRDTGYIAKIIATKAATYPDAVRRQLVKDMEVSLRDFRIPPTNFPMSLVAFKLLSQKMGPEGAAAFESLGKELLGRCETLLRRLMYGVGGGGFETGLTTHTQLGADTRASHGIPITVQPPSQSTQGSDGPSQGSRWSVGTEGCELTEEMLGIRLFVVGELAQHCSHLVTPKLQLLIESVFAAEHIRKEMGARPPSRQEAEGRSESALVNRDVASLLTDQVRSLAVATLGKMCLMDESLARKVMPRFITELANLRNHHTLRNNIMVVVHDICIVYTSLIDRHSDAVSVALRDPSVLVRKQTLTLLTRLLKENFLKFKGLVLYRFLGALLDPSPDIQALAEISIVNALLIQNPELMQGHFMECVFYFNGVHPPRLNLGGDEGGIGSSLGAACPLKGRAQRPSRLRLYRFMLKHSLVEGKWKAFCKLNSDILKAVTEESMKISDPDIVELVEDTFAILQLPELQINLGGPKRDDDDEAAESAKGKAAAKQERITKAVIEVGLMQQMVTVIPTVVTLKATLQARRSPLQKHAMDYILFLLEKHPKEVNDFLASNKRLKSEIDYQLDRENRAKERAEAKEAKRAAQKLAAQQTVANGSALSTPPLRVLTVTRNGTPLTVRGTPATPQAVQESRRKSTQLLRKAVAQAAAAATADTGRDDDDDDAPTQVDEADLEAEAAADARHLSPATREVLGIRLQDPRPQKEGPGRLSRLAEQLEEATAREKKAQKEREEDGETPPDDDDDAHEEASFLPPHGRMVSTPNRTLAAAEMTFQLGISASPIAVGKAPDSLQPAFKKSRTLHKKKQRLGQLKENEGAE